METLTSIYGILFCQLQLVIVPRFFTANKNLRHFNILKTRVLFKDSYII